MKKLSLFLIGGVLLIAIIPLYDLFMFSSTLSYFKANLKHHENLLTAYLSLTKSLMEYGKEDQIKELLDEAVEMRMIDFYIISFQGHPVSYKPAGMELLKIPETDQRLIDDEDTYLRTTALSNKFYLSIGLNKGWKSYLKRAQDNNNTILLEVEALCLLAVLGIIYYLLKDILKPLRLIRGGRTAEAITFIKNRKFLSRESHLFLQILEAYQQSVDNISENAKKLSAQVLPSLRSEISSGKTPPYEFNCVLVRMDINRYSEMFILGHRPELMQIVRNLFTDASHIVASYGGYIHEFVGDELIYYFKDEELANPSSLAASCIFDIQVASEKYLGEIEKLFAFPLSIKSSLSRGILRYDRHVQGFSLVGAAFIESVRLLSIIEDRHRHQIYCLKSTAEELLPLFSKKEKGSFQLKGYQEKSAVYEISKKEKLENLLPQLNSQNLPYLECYRSPDNLLMILKYLQQWSPDFKQQVLRQLSSAWLNNPPKELKIEILKLGYDFHRHPAETENLSTLISLMKNLISPRTYDSDCRTFIDCILVSDNPRAIANAIEVLGLFDKESTKSLYPSFADTDHPRIISQIMETWGKLELGSRLVEAFSEQVENSDAARLTGLLYSYSEIMEYWKEQNLVYLKAQSEFLTIGKSMIEKSRHSKKLFKKNAPIDKLNKFPHDEAIRYELGLQTQSQRVSDLLNSLSSLAESKASA